MKTRVNIKYSKKYGGHYYHPQVEVFGLFWKRLGPTSGYYHYGDAKGYLECFRELKCGFVKGKLKTRVICVPCGSHDDVRYRPQVKRFGLFWRSIFSIDYSSRVHAERKLEEYETSIWRCR